MKNIIIIILFLISLFSSVSCKQEGKKILKIADVLEQNVDSSLVVTKKIMYDVPIINDLIGLDKSKNNPDWFWENLPYPDGENFIKNLFEDIEKNNVKIYYYELTGDYDTLVEIPKNEVKHFLKENLNFQYTILDTVTNKLKTEEFFLDYSYVKELRFLEEWYIKDGIFYKKVIAFAPFFRVFDPSTQQEISMIKYWVRL